MVRVTVKVRVSVSVSVSVRIRIQVRDRKLIGIPGRSRAFRVWTLVRARVRVKLSRTLR